jgi:hypothetical protein
MQQGTYKRGVSLGSVKCESAEHPSWRRRRSEGEGDDVKPRVATRLWRLNISTTWVLLNQRPRPLPSASTPPVGYKGRSRRSELRFRQDRTVCTARLAMVASLPLELVEAIIANLDDDKGALRVCALVCRMWTPTSQQYIFHTFVVDDRDYLMHLRDHPRLRPLVVYLRWLTPSSCSPEDVKSLFPRVRRLFYNTRIQWAVISSLSLLDTLELGYGAHLIDRDVLAAEATSDFETGSSEHGRRAITTLRCAANLCVQILKHVQVRVRTDALRILHLPLPTASSEDIPWFRQFLTSLEALDELVLEMFMLLEEAGKSRCRHGQKPF